MTAANDRHFDATVIAPPRPVPLAGGPRALYRDGCSDIAGLMLRRWLWPAANHTLAGRWSPERRPRPSFSRVLL